MTDHRAHRILRRDHQIRTDPSRGEPPFRVHARRKWSGCQKLGPRDGLIANTSESKRGAGSRLDGADTHLAVALGGMAVTDRNERVRDLDRKPKRRTGDEVSYVEVAADLARRTRPVLARLTRRETDHAKERFDWNCGAP